MIKTYSFNRGILLTVIAFALLLAAFACDDSKRPLYPLHPVYDTAVTYALDADYADRRVFDLFRPGETQPGDSIERLFVYQVMQPYIDPFPPEAVYAVMHVNPAFPDSFPAETIDLSSPDSGVVPIDVDKYEVLTVPDSNQHYIMFARPLRDRPIGVYIELRRVGGGIDTIGALIDRGGYDSEGVVDPLILKVIYSPDAIPAHQTWDLMWRNVYSFYKGTYPLVDIFKGSLPHDSTADSLQCINSDCVSYLTVLGLDLYDPRGLRIPDGRTDDRGELRPNYGLLIFPHSRPFASDTTFELDTGSTPPLADKAPELYEYESTAERMDASKYFIRFTYIYEIPPD